VKAEVKGKKTLFTCKLDKDKEEIIQTLHLERKSL